MSRRAAALAGVLLALASAPGLAQEAPPPSESQAPPVYGQPDSPSPAQATPPLNGAGDALPPEETPAPPSEPVEPAPPPATHAAPVAAAPPANTEADAAPPPPPPPPKRTRVDAAILQASDKITAGTLRFEARVGQPVRYKDLVITVHACDQTAPEEAVADSVAHLDVVSQPVATAGRRAIGPRQVFRGWMFASSPSVHPFEHPVYDLALIACRTVSAPSPAPAAPKR